MDDHLSLSLSVVNPRTLLPGWRRQASFCFVLLNQSGKVLHTTVGINDMIISSVFFFFFLNFRTYKLEGTSNTFLYFPLYIYIVKLFCFREKIAKYIEHGLISSAIDYTSYLIWWKKSWFIFLCTYRKKQIVLCWDSKLGYYQSVDSYQASTRWVYGEQQTNHWSRH